MLTIVSKLYFRDFFNTLLIPQGILRIKLLIRKHSDCSIAWKFSTPGGGASPALKTVILDEFEAATGYARKYAIRFLSLASI